MKCLLLFVSILSMTTLSLSKLVLEHKWKYVDLVWESTQQKQQAIDSGAYNASLMFLFDVEMAQDGRIFVTAVRNKGIPVSVMIVTNKTGEGGPLLRPYPDWSWYKDDCKGITGGVYQMDIQCNHLFIVDGGRIGENQLCPPQLLIFDLANDKLVKRVTVPLDIAHNKESIGLLASISVNAPNCKNVMNDAMIYMGDTEGYALITYNISTSGFCRIESDFMKPTNPGFITNKFSSEPDGIDGITVVRNKGKFSFLFGTVFFLDIYYSAMGRSKIHKMETPKTSKCLSSETNALTKLAATLPGQTGPIASMDCALFFSDIEKTSIMCADTAKEINFQNMERIAQDSEMLQFSSGLKNRQDKLVILSNRYLNHFHETVNIREVNFRILSMSNTEIQKETNCFASCPGNFIYKYI
ncbi:major royal jelly protein 1-like [Linepithema humile]|uniref:major royal jelly protein 1-like n=1 Tax=Linepithema humile TaxID=83485 RepID=UPI00351EEDF4